MGLLDFLNDDGAKLGLGLLAAAGPSTTPMNAFQRIQMAQQGMTADKAAAMKLKLLQSQMDENVSQDALRKAQIAKMTQDQEFMSRLGKRFSGGGAGMPGAAPTVPGVPGGAVDGAMGGAPGMQGGPGMAGTQSPGAFPLSFGETVEAKLRGHDLMDAYKYANEPQELKPGSLYRNRMTGQMESLPMMGQDGKSSQLIADPSAPGGYRMIAPNGGPDIYRQYKQIDADVATGSKPIKVYNKDTKQEDYVSEAEVLRRSQGGGSAAPASTGGPVNGQPIRNPMAARPEDTDRVAIFTQERRQAAERLKQAALTGDQPAIARAQSDIDALEKEIKSNRIPMPPLGQIAPQGAGAGRGNYAAGPSQSDTVNQKFGEKMATEQGDILSKSYSGANDAASSLAGIAESRKAMAGGAFQGTGADAKLAVYKFGQSIGINIDPEKVANTDYLKSTLGNGLLEKAKTLGSNPSNADASRITDIVGSIGKDPQAMANILDWQETMARKAIEQHNGKVGQAESNGFKSQFDMRVKAPEATKQEKAAGKIHNELPKLAPVGKRMRDTETGKVMVFDGRAWKPE